MVGEKSNKSVFERMPEQTEQISTRGYYLPPRLFAKEDEKNTATTTRRMRVGKKSGTRTNKEVKYTIEEILAFAKSMPDTPASSTQETFASPMPDTPASPVQYRPKFDTPASPEPDTPASPAAEPDDDDDVNVPARPERDYSATTPMPDSQSPFDVFVDPCKQLETRERNDETLAESCGKDDDNDCAIFENDYSCEDREVAEILSKFAKEAKTEKTKEDDCAIDDEACDKEVAEILSKFAKEAKTENTTSPVTGKSNDDNVDGDNGAIVENTTSPVTGKSNDDDDDVDGDNGVIAENTTSPVTATDDSLPRRKVLNMAEDFMKRFNTPDSREKNSPTPVFESVIYQLKSNPQVKAKEAIDVTIAEYKRNKLSAFTPEKVEQTVGRQKDSCLEQHNIEKTPINYDSDASVNEEDPIRHLRPLEKTPIHYDSDASVIVNSDNDSDNEHGNSEDADTTYDDSDDDADVTSIVLSTRRADTEEAIHLIRKFSRMGEGDYLNIYGRYLDIRVKRVYSHDDDDEHARRRFAKRSRK